MLISPQFKLLLADEFCLQLKASNVGPSLLRTFVHSHQNHFTVSECPTTTDDIVMEWIIKFLDQINEVDKRTVLCRAVSELMSWGKTTQRYSFWYKVYSRIANGMDLVWFSEEDHMQLVLQSFDAEMFEQMWDESNHRNGVVFNGQHQALA